MNNHTDFFYTFLFISKCNTTHIHSKLDCNLIHEDKPFVVFNMKFTHSVYTLNKCVCEWLRQTMKKKLHTYGQHLHTLWHHNTPMFLLSSLTEWFIITRFCMYNCVQTFVRFAMFREERNWIWSQYMSSIPAPPWGEFMYWSALCLGRNTLCNVIPGLVLDMPALVC